MGSRILGFTQDLFDDSGNVVPATARLLAGQYPHVADLALAVSHDGGLGGCDDGVEFEFAFALDVILGGLEQLRDSVAR
jgi:hypothetical protein